MTPAEIIEQLQNTSGTNDKLDIIKNNLDNPAHPEFEKGVMYALDTYKTFNLKQVPLSENIITTTSGAIKLFFKFLDDLAERKLTGKLVEENNKYKEQSKSYIEGLSATIDKQLSDWELSKAEKEVAFLLLKGFSLKEVADVRGTTEKTARTQSASIYAKAGLSNRAQLSAFFLEDLLLPK
jgi:DNA-binding CsgD family transcriptional regulator